MYHIPSCFDSTNHAQEDHIYMSHTVLSLFAKGLPTKVKGYDQLGMFNQVIINALQRWDPRYPLLQIKKAGHDTPTRKRVTCEGHASAAHMELHISRTPNLGWSGGFWMDCHLRPQAPEPPCKRQAPADKQLLAASLAPRPSAPNFRVLSSIVL
jgi:hypothetical protein